MQALFINTENLKSAFTSNDPEKEMMSNHFDIDYYVTCYQSTWLLCKNRSMNNAYTLSSDNLFMTT